MTPGAQRAPALLRGQTRSRPQLCMERKYLRTAVMMAVLMVVPMTVPAETNDPATGKAEELRVLRARIEALQKQRERTRDEHDSAGTALREAEREVGRQLAELKRIERQRRAQNRRLGSLQRSARTQRSNLAREREGLARELRLAHTLGDQVPLRLLLNPSDPASLARSRQYAHYLHEARTRQISSASLALSELRQAEQSVTRQLTEIEQLRQSELGHRRSLETARAERARVHAQLGRELQGQTRQIERLRRDELELTALIRELSRVSRDEPMALLSGRFSEARGRLSLPTRGKIMARFGEPRGQGNIKWKGIFLAAPEGQEVRAVFPGRVLYADWLRGLGLLLVLDHGDGYMTLYGHNQSLYRTLGEHVAAGQAIASVGATGGPTRTGLYFEVRHDGEPRDPLRWCKVK